MLQCFVTFLCRLQSPILNLSHCLFIHKRDRQGEGGREGDGRGLGGEDSDDIKVETGRNEKDVRGTAEERAQQRY